MPPESRTSQDFINRLLCSSLRFPKNSLKSFQNFLTLKFFLLTDRHRRADEVCHITSLAELFNPIFGANIPVKSGAFTTSLRGRRNSNRQAIPISY